MYRKMFRSSPILIILLLLSALPSTGGETQQRIEKPVQKAIDTRQATQGAESQWRMDQEKLMARYEELEAEKKSLTQQTGELQEQLSEARSRIATKEKQLADIEQISDQIGPFVLELIGRLKTLVADGPPFLMKERERRIERLTGIADDPEVPISEKYRKAMEALLVEAEYGFTIETYQETIEVDGQPRLVDIFRLGRINLFFQSLDQKRCGFFNVAENKWQLLSQKHNQPIHSAIEMAAKRKPVELLDLPVGRLVIP